MDEARTTAAVVSSIGGAPSKHRCLTGPAGTWASLPLDLLLEIFRRLETTAIISCAAACRPWRRAIIGNASFLRPRPDRFLPSLLLGVFHGYGRYEPMLLRRTAGPLQSALPLNVAGYWETANSFIPSAAAANAGKSPDGYGQLLSSRDGFILLRGREWSSGLCLCNPMTGDCAFIPNAPNWYLSTYILLTSCDLSLPTSGCGSDGDGDLAVRILAVDSSDMIWSREKGIKYQLFSFTSGGGAGVWGPVRRSVELQQGFWVHPSGRSTAVCRDVVHWLGGPKDNRLRLPTWTVALDVHTGQTWMTELPTKIDVDASSSALLATTGDGRLSLILSLTDHQIQVWVLNGGDRWSLQQTVDVQKQLRRCQDDYFTTHTHLNAFCPRSGCVLASFANQEIRIDLESGPCPRIECIGESKQGYHCAPYEMDWWTYISKMKRF